MFGSVLCVLLNYLFFSVFFTKKNAMFCFSTGLKNTDDIDKQSPRIKPQITPKKPSTAKTESKNIIEYLRDKKKFNKGIVTKCFF